MTSLLKSSMIRSQGRRKGVACTAALAAVFTTTLVPALSARAQGTQTPAVTNAAPVMPGAYRPVPALRLTKTPAYDVTARLSRTTGATVLITGTLATMPITINSIGGSLETVLQQVAAALPKGTVIRAAFVPSPANGAAPSGDAVATYLTATATLQAPPPPSPAAFGSASAAATPAFLPDPAPFSPGQWEVLGQVLPLDKAVAVTGGLGLRPVYLVSLPRTKADPVATMGQMQSESLRLMMSMTPEQKQAAFDNQIGALLNMPSADRRAMLGQFMSQGANMMKSMMSLPPDQRQQLFSDFQAAAQDAGIPTGPQTGNGGKGPGR